MGRHVPQTEPTDPPKPQETTISAAGIVTQGGGHSAKLVGSVTLLDVRPNPFDSMVVTRSMWCKGATTPGVTGRRAFILFPAASAASDTGKA